jgi:hypothetical protein
VSTLCELDCGEDVDQDVGYDKDDGVWSEKYVVLLQLALWTGRWMLKRFS